MNEFTIQLFATFHGTFAKYNELLAAEREIQARLETAEKTVALTRDHLIDSLRNADDAATPDEWKPLLDGVRFVGVRLVDACLTLLQEHGRLGSNGLLERLVAGGFRFRTASPLREIHAAMLKQQTARKAGNEYVWLGDSGPVALRPHLVAMRGAGNQVLRTATRQNGDHVDVPPPRHSAGATGGTV
jgi:hypothetical protein